MNTKTKVGHTPGPWRFETDRAEYPHVAVTSVDYQLQAEGLETDAIAEVYSAGADQLANARLIAAAPELLEACKRFLKAQDENDRDGLTSATMMASSAIAKVEGGV